MADPPSPELFFWMLSIGIEEEEAESGLFSGSFLKASRSGVVVLSLAEFEINAKLFFTIRFDLNAGKRNSWLDRE